ncbi:MAG TPA: hypothetical protein VLX92_28290, partial [Kofleriaceae bacterium]|nr:hypothetical protein [Kofleriaceae bacterium]
RAELGTRLGADQWKPYHGNHGWMYGGPAQPMPTSDDRVTRLAIGELFAGTAQEGTPSSINTYDGTVTIGSGWADSNAADYVHRWLALEPASREKLRAIGFAVTDDQQFAVVDNTGHVLVGARAHAFLRDRANGGVLDYLAALLEQPGSAPHAMQAQVGELERYAIDRLKRNGVHDAMATWSDDAIRVAIHFGGWAFAAGPATNPRDYIASGGDPLKMLHAFATHMRREIGRPNGALVVGASAHTASPLAGHLDRWGNGIVATAIRGTTRIEATLAEVSTDPAYAGHVLVIEGASSADPNVKLELWDTGTLQL